MTTTHHTRHPGSSSAPERSLVCEPVVRTALRLSWAVTALMVAGALWGLLGRGVYHETTWGRAAFRGGDLVSLVVVAPLLVWSLTRVRTGSRVAALLWAGALVYNVYNYAYFVFGASFNDLFGLHILVLTASAWSLVLMLPALHASMRPGTGLTGVPARRVAVLLGSVAVCLGGIWGAAIARQAVTGHLLGGAAPPAGQHTVFAVDLTFFVSSLVVTSVVLWRRTRWGAVAGTALTVGGSTYLLNLVAAQAFQAQAGVDVATVSPLSLALVAAFGWAAVAMVRSTRLL